MGFVIVILGILYLCGVHIGKALAICAIVEGVLVEINAILQGLKNKENI